MFLCINTKKSNYTPYTRECRREVGTGEFAFNANIGLLCAFFVPTACVRLGNKKNNTVLTYSAAALQDVDFPSFSVFQCDNTTTGSSIWSVSE